MCCIWRACPCPCVFLFFIFFQPLCGMDSTTDPIVSRVPFYWPVCSAFSFFPLRCFPATRLPNSLPATTRIFDRPNYLEQVGSSEAALHLTRTDESFTWMCYTAHLVFCRINLNLVFLFSYKLGSGTGRGGRAWKVQSIDTKLYIKCWHSKPQVNYVDSEELIHKSFISYHTSEAF